MSIKVVNKLNEFNNILIIGPYPPPLGGVSVHIYRLKKLLKNANVFNLSMKQKFKGEKYIKLILEIITHRYEAIHIHSYDIKLILILLILKKFKKFKIMATSHNPRLFKNISQIKERIYKYFFKKIDILVVVGEHILDTYKVNNVEISNEIIIEPAFLPPPLEEEDKILNTYPKELLKFLESHSLLIIANAFQIVFYNGTDLYGLDMCIELTAKLKKDFPNIGFVFALANENENKEYLEKMKKRIKELKIENNFYFLTGQKEFWPLFKKVDLMIRPTNTDGDALSIRESLYFNCPAIASDVSDRPKGTILFKSRNLEDLYEKVLRTLNAKS